MKIEKSNKINVEFISATELKNIFSWNEIENQPDRAIEFFLNHNEEVIYFCEKGKLKGLITPGDILRYYEEKRKEFQPNTKFAFLQAIDFDKAKEIMERFITINEVPVIINGTFKGIIKNKRQRTPEDWALYRRNMLNMEEDLFFINLLNKWKKHCQAEIFFYDNPADIRAYLNEKQKKRYQEKYNFVLSEAFNKHREGKKYGFCFDCEKIKYIHKDGFFILEDFNSDKLKINNGHRITPNAQEKSKKIYVMGPCTALGAYVDDYNTIEYYLQNIVNKYNFPYEVVNCGMLGPNNNYQALIYEQINSQDKVVFLMASRLLGIKKFLRSEYKGDLSRVYQRIENPIDCYLDDPGHCNGTVNKKIAEFIWKDLKNSLDKTEVTAQEPKRSPKKDYFISFDVHKYFSQYIKKYNLEKEEKKVVGSIVMNCNPFTKGHRYLIEKSCEKVDKLYVFVVEEDKSYFSFEDRYEMVKGNVEDLSKVVVVPSGKYIISKDTFAQYFEKDVVTEVNSMHYDVRIFGEVLAQKLGIKYRFVGEEPFDMVTREYNETMKRILPEYGIRVEEIPRVSADNDDIISATKVRELYKNKDFEELEKYCPSFTVEYLKKLQK